MRTISRTAFALFLSVSLLAFASAASAGNWQWDHGAGFKATGPIGGANRYATTSSGYSSTAQATASSAALTATSAPSPAYQRFSYQPSPTAFKVGDRISVAADRALLMVGSQIVGKITRGERLVVSQIQGPWLWTSVTTDGRAVKGWILAEDVNLAK